MQEVIIGVSADDEGMVKGFFCWYSEIGIDFEGRLQETHKLFVFSPHPRL